MLQYKRVLLKLSGEALMGNSQNSVDYAFLMQIALEINKLVALGVQIGIVIGGGNMIRGATHTTHCLSRVTADQMGMLATAINCLAMRDVLKSIGIETRIMSSIPVPGILEVFNRGRAIAKLEKNQVVLFACGTGNPLVTTDTAASLRAIEIEADILLKATNVEGIYTADPATTPDATLYSRLTFNEALRHRLAVMDFVAFSQCNEHKMPLRVFNIHKPGALLRAATGEDEGTLVE